MFPLIMKTPAPEPHLPVTVNIASSRSFRNTQCHLSVNWICFEIVINWSSLESNGPKSTARISFQ